MTVLATTLGQRYTNGQGHLTLERENEHVREKTNNLGSDQLRHKPGCTVTEDGKRLEISDLGRMGLYYLCSDNKGADQLRIYCEADLRICFRLCRLLVFSRTGSNNFKQMHLSITVHDSYFKMSHIKLA